MSHGLPLSPTPLLRKPETSPGPECTTHLSFLWRPQSRGLSRLQPPWNPSSPHEDGTDQPRSFGASFTLSPHVRSRSDPGPCSDLCPLPRLSRAELLPQSPGHHAPLSSGAWPSILPCHMPSHGPSMATACQPLRDHILQRGQPCPRLSPAPPPDPGTLFTLHPAYCPLEFFLYC